MIKYCLSALFALLVTSYLRAEESDWLIFPQAGAEQCDVKGRPTYFANPHQTDISPRNSGYYESLADGMALWRVGIASESAVNMNVILEDVVLLPEERIKIYAPSRPDEAQIVTIMNLATNGIVQSQIVKGDSIIVEHWGIVDSEPQLKITRVNCGFMNIDREQGEERANKVGNIGDSSSCEVDATCNEEYKDVKQSVCRLIIDGASFGTGVLINNTSNDGTPYVATAAHVLLNSKIKTCIADFNFERPLCKEYISNSDGERIEDEAELVVYSEIHDVAILKLGKKPSEDIMPYWAGWDLSKSHDGIVHCIHHPMGDVRKASQGKGARTATYDSDRTNNNLSFAKNNHWLVGEWTEGTTEGGSSGSGLFNKDMYLIGFLTGGTATCHRPYNDYFWRLENSWEIEGATTTIKSVLDPKGTNATRCEGAYHYETKKLEQVFNIEISDPVTADNNVDFKGYIAGHNGVKTTAIAERYNTEEKCVEICGIYLAPRKAMSFNGQTFNVKVWSDKDGMPDEVLYEKNDLSNATLKQKKLNYIPFDEPLTTENAFHIGIEFDYGMTTSDTISLYYTFANQKDGARFKNNGTWERYCDMVGVDGLKCDLYIGYKGVGTNGGEETLVNKDVVNDIMVQRKGNKLHIIGTDLKTVSIYDVMGRKINLQKINKEAGQIIVDISSVQKGVYLLNITTQRGQSTIKVYEGL